MAAPDNKRAFVYAGIGWVLAMLVIGGLTWFRSLALVDAVVYDHLLHYRDSSEGGDFGIVLVTIDEESMGEMQKQWPWPRSYHARMIEAIDAAGAEAIGVDILFIEPSTDEEDAALVDAVQASGKVVLAAKFEALDRHLLEEDAALDGRRLVLPAPRFREFSVPGIVSYDVDVGSVVRRTRSYFRHQETTYSSFPVALFQRAFGRSPEIPEEDAPFIDYIGAAGSFPSVPAYQVLNGSVDPTVFRNKIVIIGVTFSDMHDFHATPFAKGNRRVPGLEVHANTLSTIMRGSYIVPAWRWPQVVLAVALAAITGYLVIFRSGVVLAAFTVIATVVVLWLTVWLLTATGVYMDPTYPLLAMPLTFLLVGLPVRQPLVLNTRIGPYQLYEELGRGGMAVVYRARHPRSGQVVALKRMLAEQAGDAESLSRFMREIELIRQLDHPNIIRIVDHGDVDGVPYYAMEYIQGQSLDELLRAETRLNSSDVRRFGGAVARALAQAHHVNVIHRDIKPGNILLTSTGMPKLTDFGIARQIDAPHLTRTGQLVGTPYYMAPELLKGLTATNRSDIYSLGATLYHLLSGHPPFESEDVSTVLTLCLFDTPPDIRHAVPDIDDDLANLVMACLEKDPADRPESMELIARRLDPYYTGQITVPPGVYDPNLARTVTMPPPIMSFPPSAPTDGSPLNTQLASAPVGDGQARVQIMRASASNPSRTDADAEIDSAHPARGTPGQPRSADGIDTEAPTVSMPNPRPPTVVPTDGTELSEALASAPAADPQARVQVRRRRDPGDTRPPTVTRPAATPIPPSHKSPVAADDDNGNGNGNADAAPPPRSDPDSV